MTGKPDFDEALQKIEDGKHLLQSAMDAFQSASTNLNDTIKQAIKAGLYSVEPSAYPLSEHRRNHRPGRPPKVDGDPELQSFISARIDRMTFHQIANDVAKHFPEERRVAKSAIHAWWQKNNGRP